MKDTVAFAQPEELVAPTTLGTVAHWVPSPAANGGLGYLLARLWRSYGEPGEPDISKAGRNHYLPGKFSAAASAVGKISITLFT
jgi:hypothetical protein